MAIMVDAKHDEVSARAEHAEPLGRLAILGYGAGHMLNDITSACWFTYLLLFLTDLGLSPRDAAIVMLSGQVADAFTTIFAGVLIDRFGHFKLWHGGGSILVAISFSSVFGGCLPCKIIGNNSFTLQTIGYSLFASIFNVGWAVTQVSHMSMVNCITLNQTTRVSLTSCRNAFTMVANLSLYAVALAVFNMYDAKAYADIKSEYRWIAYLSIFMGCCFVVVFLVATKEPTLKQRRECESFSKISWNFWFKKALYYQVAIVYVLIRLVTNVSQALLAFFVINDLGMPQSAKALVPAIIYISSFIVSVILQEISWNSSRLKATFTSGAVLWILSGSAIFVLPSSLHSTMYILSIIIGVANALMMVTGISMQSMLVGKDVNGCGFVYGSLSFLDKLSCGLALYVLESYQDSDHIMRSSAENGGLSVTRYGLGLIPSICALISALVTCTMELEETQSKRLTEPLLA
ncbi:major facilitator superfamily domain-containing protein 12-like [Phalaenopsis equestris]|uniref:major facilitator superfamily domain-containing protein 12-like n=1 Tax=Phalaenopsis equestris TaxID=78828 RepID=UPI0009E54840|nr:major facilitator superfamily domain-containing protein 12-like [Phalaenopsis equestris]